MENLTYTVNTKRLKILRNRSEYIITSRSRVVVHNFTEIGSPILEEEGHCKTKRGVCLSVRPSVCRVPRFNSRMEAQNLAGWKPIA